MLRVEVPEDKVGLKYPPRGEAAAGWGLWEYYTDSKKWFRIAIYSFDPDNQLYWVSITGLGTLVVATGCFQVFSVLACKPLKPQLVSAHKFTLSN